MPHSPRKPIKRKELASFEGKRVHCVGTLDRMSVIEYTYGIVKNPERFLIKNLMVEGIPVDHAWASSDEFKCFCTGSYIAFTAVIKQYRTISGRQGYGLDDVKNVVLVD